MQSAERLNCSAVWVTLPSLGRCKKNQVTPRPPEEQYLTALTLTPATCVPLLANRNWGIVLKTWMIKSLFVTLYEMINCSCLRKFQQHFRLAITPRGCLTRKTVARFPARLLMFAKTQISKTFDDRPKRGETYILRIMTDYEVSRPLKASGMVVDAFIGLLPVYSDRSRGYIPKTIQTKEN